MEDRIEFSMDILSKNALQKKLNVIIALAGCMFLFFFSSFVILVFDYDDLVFQIAESAESGDMTERSMLWFADGVEPISIALLEANFILLSILYMSCLLLCSIIAAIKGKQGISKDVALDDLRGWFIMGICVSAISGMVIQLGLYVSCNKRIAAIKKKQEKEMTIIRP